MTIWNILGTFGIFYDHLVHFVFVWYIFSRLEYQEETGNPVLPTYVRSSLLPVKVEACTNSFRVITFFPALLLFFFSAAILCYLKLPSGTEDEGRWYIVYRQAGETRAGRPDEFF
jgi:hypothetical protein